MTLEHRLAEDVKRYEKEKKNLKVSNANLERYIKETEKVTTIINWAVILIYIIFPKQIKLDQIRLKEIRRLCAPAEGKGLKNGGASEFEGKAYF